MYTERLRVEVLLGAPDDVEAAAQLRLGSQVTEAGAAARCVGPRRGQLLAAALPSATRQFSMCTYNEDKKNFRTAPSTQRDTFGDNEPMSLPLEAMRPSGCLPMRTHPTTAKKTEGPSHTFTLHTALPQPPRSSGKHKRYVQVQPCPPFAWCTSTSSARGLEE